MGDQEEKQGEDGAPEQPMSLVPLYSPIDARKGLQAYRRGDVILYTIRGEPDKVRELIGELDKRGVDELVALVSHHIGPELTEEPAEAVVEEDTDEEES